MFDTFNHNANSSTSSNGPRKTTTMPTHNSLPIHNKVNGGNYVGYLSWARFHVGLILPVCNRTIDYPQSYALSNTELQFCDRPNVTFKIGHIRKMQTLVTPHGQIWIDICDFSKHYVILKNFHLCCPSRPVVLFSRKIQVTILKSLFP